MTPTTPTTCPRCGTAAKGNFCGSCGAPKGPLACAGCGTTLTPGTKFCQRCGAAAPGGSSAPGSFAGAVPLARGNNPVPWILAGLLSVVVIGSIVYSARSAGNPATTDMANAGNTAGEAGAPSGFPTGPATDISNMTPREQFSRLTDRIQTALEARDSTQAIQFMPHTEAAFDQLSATDRDIDARYHMGMLWAQTGNFVKAKGQADSMMKAAPENLFGYYIYAALGEFQGDSTAARKARADFRDHYDAQIKLPRQEYKDHLEFLGNYRKGPGAK